MERTKMFDFISDLNDYFCTFYTAYDKICTLPGYKMPKMHDVREENGRRYTYTLPEETMNLCNQANKAELLTKLKERLVDNTFSFSFLPMNIFSQIGNLFSKEGFFKVLKGMLAKYKLSEEEAGKGLDVATEIWTAICKNQYLPTKNLILSLALTAQFSYEDTEKLLAASGEEFDYSYAKDVVVGYLLQKKVFNADMMEAALTEFKVENLFIKKNA